MKTHAIRLLVVVSLIAAVSGCMSHNLPKDTYMKGVKSKIHTPWGSHKLDIQEAGTGKAADNASKLKP